MEPARERRGPLACIILAVATPLRPHRTAGPVRRAAAALGMAAALASACAGARPPPTSAGTSVPPAAAQPEAAPAPPNPAERLDEAARLLADGLDLPRVQALLAEVPPGPARREVLLGQLAELSSDDAGAAAAYGRALGLQDDDEVRLRRALALERLGRGDEVKDDLARLRPPPPAKAVQKPERKLRPLR